jgi:3-oxo-5alpha-steroid 4-dehydrogenase
MSSGRVLWEHLRDAAVAAGVTVTPMTRVDELLLDNGAVRGVVCRTLDESHPSVSSYGRAAALGAKITNWVPTVGKAFNRRAETIWQRAARKQCYTADKVILAAGGFVFNRDMTRQHAAPYDLVSPLGTEADDGKGIALGVSAGGTTANMDRVTAWRFLSPPSAMLEGVAVGVNGKRIANEDLYGATHAEVMVREFGGRGFLIVDSAIWKKARTQLREQTLLFQRAQMASVLTAGHKKAATLPELAEKFGISTSGLLETIDAYNAGIASADGDPAHKAPDLCAPVAEGPFYGVDISVRHSLAYFVPGLTLGGLKVDGVSGLVLREDGTTVPGLYAAGRTAVGICSNSYVSGLALADCVFSGRRAGRHAARPDVAEAPDGLPQKKRSNVVT